MLSKRYLCAIIFSFILLVNPALGQSEAATQGAAQGTPSVTASTTGGGVRFTAPVGVSQLRLAIYNASGNVVFDSGLRPGSIFDWKTTDATQALIDGSYLCVVTFKDFQGKLGQRVGIVSLESGQVAVRRASGKELSGAHAQALADNRQSQKLDAAANVESLTVLTETKERAMTIAAHDGEQGQITSTKGALTLRTGDVFSGTDKEQVRVTPDGRVGIGTDKPEATLDVAGTVRARGGIVFDDGTVLTSAGRTSSVVVTGGATGDNPTPNFAGTGTTNMIAKWTDGTGTAGNSTIFEAASGDIGIGTTAPGGVFDLQRNSSSSILQRLWNTGSGGAKLRYVGGVGASSQVQFTDAGEWLTSIVGNNSAGLQFRVRPTSAPNTEAGLDASTRMTIARNGNVGINTVTPTERLEVAGNVKLSGTGNGIVFPDGSKQTTASGAGGTMTGTGIVSAINDAATVGVISDTRVAANLARRNFDNLWTGSNVFNLGLSANNALVTNVGNPVNAGDAVNKAYADSNFVKFVPGAEQLSVGDANGTATMINLRGGSTCCSGPGGHTPAFFKVFQNGSFVATGNLGIGTSPMEGKGYRTSWHTYKGAFRSGYADNEWDDANVGFFSWAGGSNSTASGLYALAFGDTNFARSTSSIAFGSGNEVKGAAGFSAGAGNRVCDTYGVALGNNAKSGGPYIDGKCDPETFNIRGLAAVAIGYNVTADQDHTMALGKFASNNGFQGTFIWSDGAPQATADTFRNTANNEFAARATGGFRFRTNLGGTTGCNLPAGSGVFNCTSSRTTKENFMLTDGEDVLSRLRKIPVSTWNYITEGQQVRHIGPMAEDFFKEFGLGTGNTSIGVQDLAGVSLAAVKALELRTEQLQQKTAEVEQLRTDVNQLRTANAALEQRLSALEQLIKASASQSQAK